MAPRDLVALIAYVAPDVKASLQQLAREHDRTLSQETHRALREHLAERQPAPGTRVNVEITGDRDALERALRRARD